MTRTPARLQCDCIRGYQNIDYLTCVNTDECSLKLHNCSPYASCLDTIGFELSTIFFVCEAGQEHISLNNATTTTGSP